MTTIDPRQLSVDLKKLSTPPIFPTLLWEDTSRQTKEKFGFLLLVVLPLGLGILPIFFIAIISLVTIWLAKPVDVFLASSCAKDKSRVTQLLRDSGRAEEALQISEHDAYDKILALKLIAKQKSEKADVIRVLQEAVELIPQTSIVKTSSQSPITETSSNDNDKDERSKRNEKIMELAEIINDLASLLQEMPDKDNERIHSLFEQSLKMGRDSVGVHDPRVTIWLMNLGIFRQQELGQLQASLELYEEVLSIRKEILGEDDPLVAQWMINMAYLLLSRPDSNEIGSRIEQLAQDALAIRKKAYGDDHIDVASSLNDCALMAALTAEDETGFSRAREFGKQSAETYERVLGADHPTTKKVRDDWC